MARWHHLGTDVTSMRIDLKASMWVNGDEHCQKQDRIVTGGLPFRAPTTHTLPPGVQGRGGMAAHSRPCPGCVSTSPGRMSPVKAVRAFWGQFHRPRVALRLN